LGYLPIFYVFSDIHRTLNCFLLGVQRDWRVDTLRGYFLVVLTIDHLYNPLRWFTFYTFGYASSPDGFHLLSGLVTGWVYTRVADRYGAAVVWRKAFRRAAAIYFARMTIVVACACGGFLPGVHGPHRLWQTLAAAALVDMHASVGMILSLYCFFLLFTPLVLSVFETGRAWLVALVSAALWIAAQLGLGTSAWGLQGFHPVGFFNIYAWQAYFVAGLYLGYRIARRGNCGLRRLPWLQLTCALAALSLLVDRHLALFGRHALFEFSPDPNHNPARFLDAACLGYLVWCVPRSVDLKLMKVGFCRFLNYLGNHSLQVVAFSMVLTRAETHMLTGASGIVRLIVTLMNVAALWLPARLHQLWRESQRSHAPALRLQQATQTSG